MQAFANIENKLIDSVSSDKAPLSILSDETSLFSADEIIFPNDRIDRPYTRYGYKICDYNFLIPKSTVSEAIKDPDIFNLPNSPSWIEGLVNIRGNIIPVMNLAKLLNKTYSDKPGSILILQNTDTNSTIGILINDLPVSLEITESTKNKNEYPDILLDYINDGFNQNNSDWVEFEPQELFKELADK